MKRSLSWSLRYVLLPLTPFIVGAVVRLLYTGTVSPTALSPSELCFSMAMMSLVVSAKTRQLEDVHLADSLTSMYQIGLILFLSLFSLTMFLETDITATLQTLHKTAQESISTGSVLTAKDIPERLHNYTIILERLRWTAFGLAVVCVPLTLVAVVRYNLDEA
jgi:hypothetical protein